MVGALRREVFAVWAGLWDTVRYEYSCFGDYAAGYSEAFSGRSIADTIRSPLRIH
jgi:hypothetical protein